MTSPQPNDAAPSDHDAQWVSAGSNREESDEYANVVARIGADWRIIVCRDQTQWIIQRRAGTRHGRARWQAKCFFRTRDGLIACCREFLGELPSDIADVLDCLPVHIARFTASENRELAGPKPLRSAAEL